MSFITRCTLLLTLAALLCIITDPAASFSSPACPPPSSPACSLLPRPPLIQIATSHTHFNQSSLWLFKNFSSSFTFTINFTNDVVLDSSPSLAFNISHLPLLPIELTFDFGIKHPCTTSAEEQCPSLLAVCESGVPQIQKPTNPSCTGSPGPEHSDLEENHFNYSVSLSYKADSAEVSVQAIVSYEDGFEINQIFVLNTTRLPPAAHYTKEIDDNIVLFVGYVTRGEPTIDIIVATGEPTIDIIVATPPPISMASDHTNENNSKSHHIKVVVWVIVGVSMVAFLVGLLILALCIKKHCSRRRSSVNSSPSPGHGVPPSTTTRAPFPHQHLKSSGTPMMSALPLSPPYNTNDFQISGTASWLKQPNAR